MFDVKNIIMCPKCKTDLSDDLNCEKCGAKYTHRHGVYNLISIDLSGEEEYLYRDEIPDDINLIFPKKFELEWEKITEDYYSHYNDETLAAQKKQDEYIAELLRTMSGTVCDLATGGGTMLQKILDFGSDDLSIVCTDINVMELTSTRIRRNGSRQNINYIAADGRYLPIKDGSIDFITSLSGFGNIPEGDRVAEEIFRILKPGGKLLIQGTYIDKNSKSYELACSVGIDRGTVEEYLLHDLKKAGFENVKSTIVAEAIWAENPYDLIPAAGDSQRFYIIEAERK